MRKRGQETGDWVLLHCPLPGRSTHADSFLTRGIGPLFSGMHRSGEVTGWYYDRRGSADVHVHGRCTDPGVLRARLAGLVLAGRSAGRPVTVCPEPGALPVRHTDLREQSSALALEIIAATATRPARIRTGCDLALATFLCAGVAAAYPGSAAAAPAGPDACPHCVEWLRSPPPGVPARLRGVAGLLAEGRGWVARWTGVLRRSGIVPVAGGPDELTTPLRCLLNQIGLTGADSRRIEATARRAVLAATSGVPLRAHRTRRAPGYDWCG